jgi:hypothetical protein
VESQPSSHWPNSCPGRNGICRYILRPTSAKGVESRPVDPIGRLRLNDHGGPQQRMAPASTLNGPSPAIDSRARATSSRSRSRLSDSAALTD